MLSLLRKWGIRLHRNKKLEQVGEKHVQTDEQMNHIRFLTQYFLEQGWTVLSIDARCKIKLGDCATSGSEWAIQGLSRECPDHDWGMTWRELYPDGNPNIPKKILDNKAVCTPFGVYCINNRKAHVLLGISSDTSEFAGKALREWWDHAPDRHSNTPILVLSDGGGSNRYRGAEWKNELSKFADYTGCAVYSCHYPRGKSKYNSVERMVWGAVSRLWEAKPESTLEIVQNFFIHLNTRGCQQATCGIDYTLYRHQNEKKKDYRAAKARGQKVTLNDFVVQAGPFYRSTYVDWPIHNYGYADDIMDEWNYILCPHNPMADKEESGRRPAPKRRPRKKAEEKGAATETPPTQEKTCPSESSQAA